MFSTVTALSVLAFALAVESRVLNPEASVRPGLTSYYNGQDGGCPLRNQMDSDGNCKAALKDAGDYCSAYCEVRNYYFYGQEIVITEFPGCRANSKCTFTTTDTIQVTQTFSFNVGASPAKRSENSLEKRDGAAALKFGFNLGASYSWSEAKSVAKGLAVDRPSDTIDKCGHWTFVPIFWTSCGTMSTSGYGHNYYSGAEPYCDDTTVSTTSNYCNTIPYADGQGNQPGQTIFVLVDCQTGKLLPKDKQDPIYQIDGVAGAPFPS